MVDEIDGEGWGGVGGGRESQVTISYGWNSDVCGLFFLFFSFCGNFHARGSQGLSEDRLSPVSSSLSSPIGPY